VEKLLGDPGTAPLSRDYGHEAVVYAIRRVLGSVRKELTIGDKAALPPVAPNTEHIVARVSEYMKALSGRSFRPVINATGIILHTNLGRAPLGDSMQESKALISGYSNLEYDLHTASRGEREDHLKALIGFLTNAEDSLTVNNNAAAIFLTLNTLAGGRQVIVSRGELIEIGGSFRLPDIMAASGARMVEVGATNRTRIEDYEAAIGPDTALLFKAHKSNFAMSGFTQECSISQLVELGKKHSLPVVYDLGSGLLRKPKITILEDEPDARGALEEGAHLVTFSGDKLLGGPQAGIVVGKKPLVERLSRAPLMRALRVGKVTLSLLAAACRASLTEDSLLQTLPVFQLLNRSKEKRKDLANELRNELDRLGVGCEVRDTVGRCGGGTLPHIEIESFAAALHPPISKKMQSSRWADRLFMQLHALERPVIGVLRRGELLLDVLAVFDRDISSIARSVDEALSGMPSHSDRSE
jgi:L-seryl-tRNA(Ser) seleniumtransferase